MELKQLRTKYDLTAYAQTRIGGRSENQDSYGAADTPFGFLAVVCDGMGGGPGGKLASTIAVKKIIEYVSNESVDEVSTTEVIENAIRKANEAIIAYGEEHPESIGMGSTCVAIIVNEDIATIAHVGDSRIYQFRGSNKVHRTFDHSLVFDLVKQNIITEEQARLSAQSNIITKCLGSDTGFEPESCELPYKQGDKFMLCTDGIHGVISEDELVKMATIKDASVGRIIDDIATHVDGKGRSSGGGHDNLTILMVQTEQSSNTPAENSRKLNGLLFAFIAVIALISLSIGLYFIFK